MVYRVLWDLLRIVVLKRIELKGNIFTNRGSLDLWVRISRDYALFKDHLQFLFLILSEFKQID